MGTFVPIALGLVFLGLGRWFDTHEFWSVTEARERARWNPQSSFRRENYRQEEYLATRVLPPTFIVLGAALIVWGVINLLGFVNA